ncbi:MAG: glycosyltransferase family 9 protein [Planctomycetota bacterium]
MKSKAANAMKITVCGGEADLYRNNPNVSHMIGPGQAGADEKYDMSFMLSLEEAAGRETHLIDCFGECLGVELLVRTPRIYIDGLDYVQTIRFGTGCDHPRIAIAAGGVESGKMWSDADWLRLCEILVEKLGANIFQFGDSKEEFFGFGRNLIGKVSSRQAATILSMCDFLVCVDNGYAHLAAAVDTPHVVLFADECWERRMHPACSLAVVAEGGENCWKSNLSMEDISLASVIDGIVQLCGISKGQKDSIS